ncbi:hypothetical protein QJV37_00620 [Listeria cossartiae subsp. cayugensis]|uniref:Uncharacterized protein n=1 Tax=Listeria cossartiae subsp. cayugensis TaxID=2713505 RepID=A0ABU2IIY6_9LIST|nr:hypothetical protein [Listeria cossartiae]MDT0003275.1 hypothetical protein [Listeria cossartiae subsp. cayugensis]MDT0036070.1 hypothetical protein [Listeria cossartiae subsp. cayugensis]MDT0043567.1 hypothetical protein [Listeria cossartiae subsp. cayugensis]MDT0112626.1 hypothetical protein [Listeria cossartiae subsp. cayugensis]
MLFNRLTGDELLMGILMLSMRYQDGRLVNRLEVTTLKNAKTGERNGI